MVEQEIVVAVTDTTGPNQPKGKQSRNPSGIFYTPSSGIWQTVWLEPVAHGGGRRAQDDAGPGHRAPSPSRSTQPRNTVTAVARDTNGKQVGTVTGPANTNLGLPMPNPHLWTPDDPYLYQLEVTAGQRPVKSYFGMRSIGVANVGGYPKLTLNGQADLLAHACWTRVSSRTA